MASVHAYDPQIRLQVVHRRVVRSQSYEEILEAIAPLRPSISSMKRWVKGYRAFGAVVQSPAVAATRGRKTKLSSEHREILRAITRADSAAYLVELRDALFARTRTYLSTATLCRELKYRVKLPRKKATKRHRLVSPVLRARYLATILPYSPDMVLYADESHFSERYLNRTHARAPPGERAEVTEDASRSTPYTLLAVISVGGLFAAGVKEGGYNAEEFNELISTEVMPRMNPFPGPRSVLIIDNAPSHHDPALYDLFVQQGKRLHFTPPYCPEFNPCEPCFHQIKSRLKRTRELHRSAEPAETLYDVTVDELRGEKVEPYYRKCGWKIGEEEEEQDDEDWW